jgi:hypothetical protein
VQWLATAEEYAEAVSGQLTSPLPLLRSADAPTARWEEILRSLYGGHVAPRPGACCVLAWSSDVEPAAELYARRSRFDLIRCATLHDCLTAISEASEREVVIVAFAERFTICRG